MLTKKSITQFKFVIFLERVFTKTPPLLVSFQLPIWQMLTHSSRLDLHCFPFEA
jgi:hypothetical protein